MHFKEEAWVVMNLLNHRSIKIQTLTTVEMQRVSGGSDTIAWGITGASVGTSVGSGAGTMAAVMNGALTGASWGRWGGLAGLAVGALAGAAYGYLR